MPVITDGETFINSLGLGLTVLACLLMLVLPRRYALVPVIILTCYMTMGERLMIGGANFSMIRILTFVGWIRIIIRGEIRSLCLNGIDKAMVCWTFSGMVFYTVLWQTSQAFVNRLGHSYDVIGLYFLFRFLVHGIDDIRRIFRIVAILIVPLAVSMLVEKMTGRNSFSVFGGVMEFTRIRDGSLRCQGPFAHPILAGTFGATLLPWFVGLWYQAKRNRVIAGLAIASALIITVTSASSGPALVALAGIVGLLAWHWRRRLRTIRWTIALGLITLHLVMKSPVWYLLARVDVFGGSTGFHRAWLIDTAVKHFSEWWLLGIKDSGVWDPMLADVTNQYLAEGFRGGLITMLLFILIIVLCFRAVGCFVTRTTGSEPFSTRFTIWALGASLFGHVLGYLSISYFDQNAVMWYLLLAMISTATGVSFAKRQATPAIEPQVWAPDRFGDSPDKATPVGTLFQ
ncbi:MAG: hypothetical protein WAM13_18430 [Candidatus Sulfotelmatobacter sp.]